MIEIIRTDGGEIKAVCEWYQVDEKGQWDSNGEYIWIAEVEVSQQYRNSGCLKQFISMIIRRAPTAKYGYFWRKKKYPNKGFVIYTKEQWVK